MNVSVRLSYLVCAVLALGVLTASARAAVMPAQPPTAGFEVKGSNGYRVGVTINDLGAQLSVNDGEVFGSGVEYQVPAGRSSHDEFSARFGKLGRISVHFNPSGKVRRAELLRCAGAMETIRYGTFEGTVRFRGEDGYTESRAKRVAGEVRSAPRRVCRPAKPRRLGTRPGEIGSGDPLVATTLSASSSLTDVWFYAARLEVEGGSTKSGLEAFTAYTTETREGMEITRHVVALPPQFIGFNLDQVTESATVAPPVPFSGTATFQRFGPNVARWEGPLAVSFPGRPDVPLTGGDFASSLVTAPPDYHAFPVPYPGLR